MTQNTYEELADFVTTQRGKRIVQCASALASSYRKADPDVVLTAAMFCGNFEDAFSGRCEFDAVSPETVSEILTRREQPVEKIAAVTEILHKIALFSTNSVQKPLKSALAGGRFTEYLAVKSENSVNNSDISQPNTAKTLENTHKSHSKAVDNPEFSTLSTRFSTDKAVDTSFDDNAKGRSSADDQTSPPDAEKFSLEEKIVFDAVILSTVGAAVLAENLRFGELPDSRGLSASDFYTKRGALLFETLRQNEDTIRSTLSDEASTLDDAARSFAEAHVVEEPIYHRLGLIAKNSGFRMEGYFVWCGSVIRVDKIYHMYASRWRESLTFPSGYMVGSEIVHAVAASPSGPFVFRDVVLAQRPRGYWDSQFAHNPQITRIGGLFVLFYLGSALSKPEFRRIGWATSRSPDGPWTRSPAPIDLGIADCNNPAAWIERDSSVLLAFRHSDQRIGIARAKRFDGAYDVLSYDILPGIVAEDPFLYHDGRRYVMIVEDGTGALTGHQRHGAELWSEDGVSWRPAPYIRVYDHTLMFDDLSIIEAERRERPQLLLDETGRPTQLYTAVLSDGKTWNCCQPITD